MRRPISRIATTIAAIIFFAPCASLQAQAAGQKFQRVGCDSKTAGAELQALKDGTWVDVSPAQGWTLIKSCPTVTQYAPWAVADLPVGTEIRWHIFDPGGSWSDFFPAGLVSDANNPWTRVQNVPLNNPGHMLLMTDGSVLFNDNGSQGAGSAIWWKLSPDSSGNYVDGTWTQIASTSSDYQPANSASAVLPDGRVLIVGGDMNGTSTWVGLNRGEIYDPVANTWTPVNPPNNGQGEFASVADAPSVVLPSGEMMFGPSGNGDAGAPNQKSVAIFNASNLSWQTVDAPSRQSANPETGFTALPNGEILSISTVFGTSDRKADLFNPQTKTWTPTSSMPISIVNPATADNTPIAEIGPALLMPSGKVFAEGSNSNTAIYDAATNTWSAGPTTPTIGGQSYVAADAPSAILPDGSVLTQLGPVDGQGHAVSTAHMFIFNGTSFKQIDDPANSNIASSPAFTGALLPLPNGQVMMTNRSSTPDVFVYTPSVAMNSAYAPIISTVGKTLVAGSTNALTGLQLNGLTTGASYGDDWNPNTDYPLVQITNATTGHVRFARTHDISSYLLSPKAPGSLQFDIPTDIESGPSTLRVIASGFASDPVKVTLSGGTNVAAAAPTPAAKPAATKKSIVCVKNKQSKKVTGDNPVCPAGYKLGK
jgi:Kelch motif